MANLKRRNSQSRHVSDKPGANYAPAVFAKEPEAIEAGLTAKQLEAAMERLFKSGKIRVEIMGPPSRQLRAIVIVKPGDLFADGSPRLHALPKERNPAK